MSSFLRKGKRQLVVAQKKKAKQAYKDFNKMITTMQYLDGVFTAEQVVLTEENVVEEVAKRTNIKLSDRMYKLLVDNFKTPETNENIEDTSASSTDDTDTE